MEGVLSMRLTPLVYMDGKSKLFSATIIFFWWFNLEEIEKPNKIFCFTTNKQTKTFDDNGLVVLFDVLYDLCTIQNPLW